MSSATVDLSSSFAQFLPAFLVGRDQRIDSKQAIALVMGHKCKKCRITFGELARQHKRPIFVVDSQGVIHEFCPKCAFEFRRNDAAATFLDPPTLEDEDMRRALFGIMVGNLRHTRLKGEPKSSIAHPAVTAENGGVQERKPNFVRRYPTRHGKIIAVRR